MGTGDICQYWAVLGLSDIFIGCDTQYQCRSDSSWRCSQDNHPEVCDVVDNVSKTGEG